MAKSTPRTGTVYGLVATDAPTLVRYVGQTIQPVNYRLCKHRHDAKMGKTGPVRTWVRGVLARGADIAPVILERDGPLDVAEAQHIARLTPTGLLLNERTPGVRGAQSEATKRRMAAAQRQRCSDPQESARRSERTMAAMARPDVQVRHRAAVLAAKARPDVLDKNRGTRNGSAKLDEAKVLEMRKRFANGESAQSIANGFGVAQPTAWKIVHRHTWTHVS